MSAFNDKKLNIQVSSPDGVVSLRGLNSAPNGDDTLSQIANLNKVSVSNSTLSPTERGKKQFSSPDGEVRWGDLNSAPNWKDPSPEFVCPYTFTNKFNPIPLVEGENRKWYKRPAFTLAEVMVIMAVMTVVLAAVAPIFTSRYSNMAADTVWGNVGASNMNDIYTDAPIRSMMQETLIGITPADMEDIRRNYQPYSKVIIRSSDKVGGNKLQKQIQFNYSGSTIGYLFAGNSNLLLGGKYPSLEISYIQPDMDDITAIKIGAGAAGNTAMGNDALNALTTGKHNSAFGYHSLSNLTSGSANTAAGVYAGLNLKTSVGNTLIGYHSYDAQSGNYNTVLSNNTSSMSSTSNYTTAVGNNVPVKGDYNVGIGDSSNAIGLYNTAIGYSALRSASVDGNSYNNFKYNTAIGYNACKGIGTSAQYKTCIGGAGVDTTNMSTTAQNFFTDTTERVLIGRPASAFNSAATLEVHNITSTPSGKYPYPNNISGAPKPGDASVVVNGNLIVRGQTFMMGRSPFPIAPNAASTTYSNTISLMGFKLYKESTLDHKPLIGWDGSEYTQRIKNADSYLREAYTGREHCICTYSCSNSKDYPSKQKSGYAGRDSYDWSYLAFRSYPDIFDNSFGGYNYFWGDNSHKCGGSYHGNVYTAANIELDAAHNITEGNGSSSISQLLDGGSCCPILTENGIRRRDALSSEDSEDVSSDIRLKNVGSEFKTGFEALAKLKIYNFRFKDDKTRNLHSGVMAQDLKQVFPNSVSKDKKGYYQIRRDEMFYAVVNSVKEFYSKITNLAQRIGNDVARITALKKENKELKNKLLLLSEELDKLEK